MQKYNSVNGPTERTVWQAIDWQKTNRRVRNLRRRIFRASREGDLARVRSLQKLVLRSHAVRLKAVRTVTQENEGRLTPGVDKLVVKTAEERAKLVDTLKLHQPWRAMPVRRVYIPKANGKMRPLGIPTILDRAMQAVVKTALEPEWEARFESCSYGFRPGRGCHDAIGRIYPLASPHRRKKWIVDADIEAAFDKIGHDALLGALGSFPAHALISQWLRAGYVEDGIFHETETGTPQGGVISPLLANIAFHGMEKALGIRYDNRGGLISHRGLVRYADDLVIFCESEADAYAARAEMAAWLAPRGLQLSERKTRIVHLSDGFDFLGFNVRQYPVPNTRTGLKLLIKPSRGAVKKFRTRLRGEWRNMRGQNITAVLQRFNPVIRGWANYYRGVVSKVTFAKLDNWMFQHEVRWAKRTHPKKSWNWLKRRYWGRLRRNSRSPWVFGDANGSNAPLLNFSWTPIERHVIVKGTNSPDDPTLDAYWENRNKRRHTKLSRRQQAMAESQNGICLVCGESLHNGERLYTHNPKPWKVDGAQYLDDQQLLHLYCHQQLLAKEKQDRRRKRFA
ncbi:group II intron reverse transcriptase/maturase (plasmid) [Agrobacterium leguminum]|uniref:group II intron reverse transcriptase/maturase n=1 Tax=Agrobacterium leguminum TaxID=2792015 RepID=UPI00272C56A0|nr:group II intron reverse transcriptase/maturase [Agrobacterium leguminum]WLE00853.1 group II intron reverse transcriptase/maturase [Agrobacterium leguminum]